jgi:hypothetical protein
MPQQPLRPSTGLPQIGYCSIRAQRLSTDASREAVYPTFSCLTRESAAYIV